eukprot:TRINITY_DN18953_c0_g1_i1.p1 TRINITY_DN18953_c0_g1~~TRINITY_DN18953_c0_g1_i1.p1  ORF type:complete len:184 (-),score=51.08 TRINITY_DN18953_c0_g1_i1:646-1197(-)
MAASAGKKECPYELLGVSRDASPKDIERAWRQKARVHHPDKAPESEKASAEERFKRVAEAHELLADPERRQLYDLHGIQEAPPAGSRRWQSAHPWDDLDGDDDAFGFDEAELQELLRQMFGGGPREAPIQRTEADVFEGALGLVIFGGLAAGFVWLSRQPSLQHFVNWAWWQWRFFLFDIGLR